MKDKNFIRTLKALITAILCFAVVLCPFTSFAADTEGSITLKVADKESKTPIKDAVIRIYKFAEATKGNDSFSFSYNKSFRLNGMDISELSDTYFPVHLSAFAEENKLTFIEKSSDDSGNITFDKLSLGAYLIVPVSVEKGYLTPSPFIVTIPMHNSDDNSWYYHIDASPKLELVTDTAEKTYLTVKKQWVGTENHPESVTIALMMDGEITETVILDNTNSWQKTWENLDKRHTWSVAEINIPTGFLVSYNISEMTVTVINTAQITSEETTTGPDELINTGQLNWPVPVLSIAGLLLFSMGWALFTFNKKEEDAA